MLRTCIGLALVPCVGGWFMSGSPARHGRRRHHGSQAVSAGPIGKGASGQRGLKSLLLAILVSNRLDDAQGPATWSTPRSCAALQPHMRAVLRNSPSTTHQPCRVTFDTVACRASTRDSTEARSKVPHVSYTIRPCCCGAEMRSVAYRPASTNSTHDGPHGRVAGGVHLEGLFPGRRHALQPLGIRARRQHVADLDLHALRRRSRRSRPGRAGRRIPRTRCGSPRPGSRRAPAARTSGGCPSCPVPACPATRSKGGPGR